jgi:uncharacterized protein YlzI (FlbEa/FlbD family)
MAALARVTENERGSHVFLNPDHVRSVQEIPGGTRITFSDGETLMVKESATEVVGAIQAAK